VFYHADGVGNITALLDRYQKIAARYLYDPYGNIIGKWGPLADVNRYRFSSKEVHPQSGLYYYGVRFYEPNLQRWLNRDPIGEAGGVNLYRANFNNPLRYVDPWGLLAPYPGPLITVITETAAAGTEASGGAALLVPLAPVGGAGLGIMVYGPLFLNFQNDPYLNPLGVNAPPQSVSMPLPKGFVLGLGEYRDNEGNIRDAAGNIVRDKYGREIKRDKKCEEKKPTWPGNNPSVAPPGTEWRGKPGSTPGSSEGNYYNPKTGESFHPDLSHPGPIGPHWDYRAPDGTWYRIFPDGSVVAKR
jgi:RHS repeat-associated protein